MEAGDLEAILKEELLDCAAGTGIIGGQRGLPGPS